MKKEYQDKIDEYLLHRMSDEERKRFVKETDDDKELQEQLEFTENVQQVMKSRNEKLAKMKEWMGDDMQHTSNHRLLYWLSGIAAIFIVGFFINLFWTDENQNIGVDNVTIRDATSYSGIEQLLEQRKYDEALSQIEHKASVLRSDSVKNCQDLNIDEDARETKMRLIIEQQDELNWLKVHALLGLHRHKDAISLLDAMRHSDNDYQSEADSLYQVLSR